MYLIHKVHLEKHCINVDTIVLSVPILEFHTFIDSTSSVEPNSSEIIYLYCQFPKTAPPYQSKLITGVGGDGKVDQVFAAEAWVSEPQSPEPI